MSWLLIAAAIAVGALVWNLLRRFASGHLQKLNDNRRASSRIVSRGGFVDGGRRLEVALALTESAFYYENPDLKASLDLEWIEEIEYDSELATGRTIADGKVLRLRCHRKLFEFVLADDVVPAWQAVMPPRRGMSIVIPQMTGSLAPELA